MKKLGLLLIPCAIVALMAVAWAGTKYDSMGPASCKMMLSDDSIVDECDAVAGARKVTLPGSAALADATANPTIPGMAAFMMCFNGTTWDRCLGGLTDTDDGSIATGKVPSLIANLNYAFDGTAWARVLSDPCSRLAKTFIPINISTNTTTEITPSLAGSSTNYYVCSLNLVTAGANNVALVDDDSDGCGSVTSGLAGGTTAASGWNFAANGGIAIGNGASSVFKTVGTNRVICLVTSAATQLSGSMSVVAAP